MLADDNSMIWSFDGSELAYDFDDANMSMDLQSLWNIMDASPNPEQSSPEDHSLEMVQRDDSAPYTLNNGCSQNQTDLPDLSDLFWVEPTQSVPFSPKISREEVSKGVFQVPMASSADANITDAQLKYEEFRHSVPTFNDRFLNAPFQTFPSTFPNMSNEAQARCMKVERKDEMDGHHFYVSESVSGFGNKYISSPMFPSDFSCNSSEKQDTKLFSKSASHSVDINLSHTIPSLSTDDCSLDAMILEKSSMLPSILRMKHTRHIKDVNGSTNSSHFEKLNSSSHFVNDSDLCIIEDEEVSCSATSSANKKSIIVPQNSTSIEPLNHSGIASARVKPNDERLVFRAALQRITSQSSPGVVCCDSQSSPEDHSLEMVQQDDSAPDTLNNGCSQNQTDLVMQASFVPFSPLRNSEALHAHKQVSKAPKKASPKKASPKKASPKKAAPKKTSHNIVEDEVELGQVVSDAFALIATSTQNLSKATQMLTDVRESAKQKKWDIWPMYETSIQVLYDAMRKDENLRVALQKFFTETLSAEDAVVVQTPKVVIQELQVGKTSEVVVPPIVEVEAENLLQRVMSGEKTPAVVVGEQQARGPIRKKSKRKTKPSRAFQSTYMI
ncbi:uncharacterized protein LOC124932001 [Impatiens glandulifera]|uniref:uncharacterized protein LOC124932001 n=1 Tax=Impatiens glandulifera TaxID=253017 RepID=UPI001FB186D0|nr:uncharacterized protein LOC124932001 [Impatiens glandulifera]